MPKYSAKPNVDWAYIEQRVRAGDSFRAIEESLPEDARVSHQAISKRADKEGWTEAARLSQVASTFKVAESNGKASISRKLAIIEALEKGVLLKTAAGAVGIGETTLQQWKREDEAFRVECEAAIDRFIQKNLNRIDAAAERGDWKAAQWMLGKHPRSKADYAEEKQQGGASLNIVLSIPKPGQAQELKAIDVPVELIEDKSGGNQD
jgi:hypothetical protein